MEVASLAALASISWCWLGLRSASNPVNPGGGLGGPPGGGGGGGSDPNCIDKKYFVAAWRSCSLSSAVWRLQKKHHIVLYEGKYPINLLCQLVSGTKYRRHDRLAFRDASLKGSELLCL